MHVYCRKQIQKNTLYYLREEQHILSHKIFLENERMSFQGLRKQDGL